MPSIRMPLQPTEIASRPWETMFFDFIGPLPKDTDTGFTMIAIASCQLTKMIHLIPCHKNVNAQDTAMLFLHHI